MTAIPQPNTQSGMLPLTSLTKDLVYIWSEELAHPELDLLEITRINSNRTYDDLADDVREALLFWLNQVGLPPEWCLGLYLCHDPHGVRAAMFTEAGTVKWVHLPITEVPEHLEHRVFWGHTPKKEPTAELLRQRIPRPGVK
jgi:hypothetical protein